MQRPLPQYAPPLQRRAAVAAGTAPLLVLLAFTALVIGAMDPSTAFAVFAAATAWVVYEMHAFQASTDRYNAEYASRHLQWRSDAMLHELAVAPACDEHTRRFVRRFVDGQRVLLRDGQLH